jgi:hypothetical protein
VTLPVLSARARRARSPLERATDRDELHDYILHAYTPLAPPEGKLRSINVLVESFALRDLEEEGLHVVRLLRDGLGPFRTVFGIKRDHGSGALFWELYFYDFERTHADLSIARLGEILHPAVRVDAREPWPLPWHMISVEIGPDHLKSRAPARLNVYIDMRSYELSGTRFTLENVYTFHDPRRDIDAILHRLRSSVHFDPERDGIASLMPPSLRRCGRVCVANKRGADAVYFSRITTPALGGFLAAQGWPAEIQALVRARAPELDHLLWDVGIDFHRDEGGALRIRKTGLYGTF